MVPIIDYKQQNALRSLLNRSAMESEKELQTVKSILSDVRSEGDAALFQYTQKLDGARLTPDTMIVGEEEIAEAYRQISDELLQSLRKCTENIRVYHERQKRQSWMDIQDGKMVGQIIRPLQRVGTYIPGGRAAYPSTVLMNVIPAKVAGVSEVVLATPCNKQGKVPPLTLVAAKEAGANIIFKMGGAQAIAALAYGTETVPRVDKITGPGNIYVALAKREVFGYVGIDMIAGPSEVLILADEHANSMYVAADMLAQAEHDPMAAAILITDSKAIAEKVVVELEKQLSGLSREVIADQSLREHGAIVLVDDLKKQGVDLANQIAPEHLELLVQEPMEWLGKIHNAGAIFLGEYSPEPVGDYYAGPNHTLPTNGTARFFSPMSVDDFIKKSSIIQYSRNALRMSYQDIACFAEAEGLQAHAKSVNIRFEED